MMNSSVVFVAMVVGWSTVAQAGPTMQQLDGPRGLITKAASCCQCILHLNPQAGCSKYDCEQCQESAPIPNIEVKRSRDCPKNRVLVCTDQDSTKKSICTLMCGAGKKAI
jgi:hypothetical protein